MQVRSALEVVVRHNVAALELALADVELTSSAYALALPPDDFGEVLSADVVYVGLEADRVRALAQETEWNAFRLVWDTNEWAIGPLMTEIEETAALAEASAVVVAYAEEIEEIPNRLVLREVARQLTQAPPISPVTDDFVAFLFEEGFNEELIDSLEASATPSAAAALRAKGLLPRSSDELDGAPRFW